MSTDYEPGTIAIATVVGEQGVRVSRYDGGWARLDDPDQFYSDNHDSESGMAPWVTDVRPLVVLDLEGVGWSAAAMVNWLRALEMKYREDTYTPRVERLGLVADQIEAQTKPPRIPEPGLWGVVEAALSKNPTRVEFVCTKHGWTRVGGSVRETDDFAWESLIDPVLIREGVKP